jgi:hypothetical protein
MGIAEHHALPGFTKIVLASWPPEIPLMRQGISK